MWRGDVGPLRLSKKTDVIQKALGDFLVRALRAASAAVRRGNRS